jgi:hypothetical protein
MERSLESLPDEELLRRLTDLLGRSRRIEADLVAHIGEVDRTWPESPSWLRISPGRTVTRSWNAPFTGRSGRSRSSWPSWLPSRTLGP